MGEGSNLFTGGGGSAEKFEIFKSLFCSVLKKIKKKN